MEKITLENMEEVVSKKTSNCPDCECNELQIVFVAGGRTGLFQSSSVLGIGALIYFAGIKAVMCTKCHLIIKQFAYKK